MKKVYRIKQNKRCKFNEKKFCNHNKRKDATEISYFYLVTREEGMYIHTLAHLTKTF